MCYHACNNLKPLNPHTEIQQSVSGSKKAIDCIRMIQKNQKLTTEQQELLADWGKMVRKYNIPAMAKLFGVSRQRVHQLMEGQDETRES